MRHGCGFVCLLLGLVPAWAHTDPTPRDREAAEQANHADTSADAAALLQALRAHWAVWASLPRGKLDRPLERLRADPDITAVPKSLRRTQVDGSEALSEDASGAVQVHVHLAEAASSRMITQLQAQGFRLELLSADRRTAQGWVKSTALDTLSKLDGVRRLSLPSYGKPQQQGSVTTAGDIALRFDTLRLAPTNLGGRGIRVGVISDGVENLATSQATNDLGTVKVLDGCNSGDSDDGVCDEGTAMLEIIHDIAPDATLAFCGGQPSSRGTSNLDFISCAGRLAGSEFNADIIVDDLLYASEPMLEDGDSGSIANAVEEAIDKGVIWVSAVGNNGSSDSNRQFYTADYIPLLTADVALGSAYDSLNDFAFAATRSLPVERQLHGARNRLTVDPGKVVKIVLQWDDPFDGTANDDYDLFVVEPGTNQIIDFSADVQDGERDARNVADNYPVEMINFVNASSGPKEVDVVIARRTGSETRRLKLFTCFQDSSSCDLFYANNEGQVIGHPGLPEVLSVGAIDAEDPGLNTIEDYSSTGPAAIYRPAYSERAKPDLVATDRVEVTGAGGFSPVFAGTSAAAPHVAALLALLKEVYPDRDLKKALLDSAIDLGDSGRDSVFGAGLVDGILANNAAFAQAPGSGNGNGSGDPSGNPGSSGGDQESGAGSVSIDLLMLFGLALSFRARRRRSRL